MATGLRSKGIKAHLNRNTRRSLSYDRNTAKKIRRGTSNSSDFYDSEEEDDVTDRGITDNLRHKDDDPLFKDLSNSDDRSRAKVHLSSPSNLRKRSKLYPDLPELEDEAAKAKHEGLPPFILIGIVFLFILLLFIVSSVYKSYQANHNSMKTKTLEDIWKEMEEEVIQLSKLTNQSKHFWIQFLSQLKILSGEVLPIQPAIILAVVPFDSALTNACLSHKILDIVSNAFEDSKYISFDVRSHMGRNSTLLKHDLDDFFQNMNTFHAAAIYNLEKLQPEAALILHAYCDNENAPFKRSLFYFTLEVDIPYSSIEERSLDYTVSDYLTNLWSQAGLRRDDIGAIVSRIGNSPVLFRPENKDNIYKHCPY